MSQIKHILREATRKPEDRLKVLTFATHEAYQSNLAATNIDFYLYHANGIKTWNDAFRPIPPNHIRLRHREDHEQVDSTIPAFIDFDLVWSQSKAGQWAVGNQLSKLLGLPHLVVEHTLPTPQWRSSPATLKQLKLMKGDINVFISEYSMGEWGWTADEAEVIYHGIDMEVFADHKLERQPYILSVVNDWISRNWCCGFELWRESVQGLPVHPVGATPGLSEAAKSVEDLVREYNTAQIFINTSLISPIPTSLLEAAACGCAIVSTNNCAIGELITHGVNGFLANQPSQINMYLRQLLGDRELREKFGQEARKAVIHKFNKEVFVRKWENAFHRAAGITFKG